MAAGRTNSSKKLGDFSGDDEDGKEVSESSEEFMDLAMEGDGNFEADVDFEDYTDNSSFENENCGICMDVVMDRGVLDNCNHWFCFECIENWATITNLCPLCKNEFLQITCIPVYDTFGNFKIDEHSLLRDDNWFVQERNSTISFPSYYINEDAVKCLDGDACKIRNGLLTSKEDLVLDTSIACDSCDMWYHAFCVGFDPETTTGTSWLCPRCLTDKARYQYNPRCGVDGHPIDTGLTGEMSVSVVDSGETAIVVSMFDKKQPNETTIASQSLFFEEMKETPSGCYDDSLIPVIKSRSVNSPSELSVDLLKSPSTFTPTDINQLGDPFLKDVPTDSTIQPNDHVECTRQSSLEAWSPVDQKISSYDNSFNESVLLRNGSDVDVCLNVSLPSFSSDRLMDCKEAADEAVEVEKMAAVDPSRDVNENDNDGIGKKSIQGSRDNVNTSDQAVKWQRDSHCETDIRISTKRGSVDESFQAIPLQCQNRTSDVSTFQENSWPETSNREKISLISSGRSDIISIVQETGSRSSSRLAATSSTDTTNSAGGVRMKKIMRVAETKESSVLVQELKKEIRDAVHKNPSKDFGKDGAFDGKLLAAFRAAMVGPKNGEDRKVHASHLRIKNSMLKCGKTRDNLTKKIYGTSSGKRKRAWDRDWEIEFWRHRCSSKKIEKVETLQSVLDLLNGIGSSEKLNMNEDSEEDSEKSILNRVYLADTSVFPRSKDIQPLSSLGGSSMIDIQNKDKMPKRLGNSSRKGSAEVKHGKPYVSALKSKERAIDSKALSQQPHTYKSDKKKWAMEILARKSSLAIGNTSKEKQIDNTALKGSHPLLAQLSVGMKPILEPSHHKKVPLSVRQAQLNRLTEFYLREANVPVVSGSVLIELAVADAVNVEKDIMKRSNSKLVYTNLCAQQTINYKHRKTEDFSSQQSAVHAVESIPISEEATITAAETCDSIELALKMTGLFSDSPPNSPDRLTKTPNTNACSQVNSANGHCEKDIVDMGSNVELNIHQDLGHDLKYENDIVSSNNASALVSNLQSEDGDSKINMTLSTPNSDKLDQNMEAEERAMEEPNLQKYTDGHQDVAKLSSEKERSENPLEKEHKEESYDPVKEQPIVENLPIKEREVVVTVTDNIPSENENNKSNKGVISDQESQGASCTGRNAAGGRLVDNQEQFKGENSPTHSVMSENVPRPETKANQSPNHLRESRKFVSSKVEAYIKEHIRPLCKSGIITVEQYRWAVNKTTSKVMSYHHKERNASFLIKEGEKVKKLAQQYAEATQQKGWKETEGKKPKTHKS